MLNTFPDLLLFSFFAPTLLRIAVAVAFAYIAYIHFKRRAELMQMRVPLLSTLGPLLWLVMLIEAVIALALLFGYHTQIAALAGLVLSIKHAIFAKRYARAIPLCRGEYFFIIVILLSLLLTGGGAFAFDLPL